MTTSRNPVILNINAQGLSSHALKCFALIFMTLDHIGAILQSTTPELATILRIVGRAAAPIFAFQLVESFRHTRSRKAMSERLLMFAVLAQIPFSLFCYVAYDEYISIFQFNILFNFYITFQWLRRIDARLPISNITFFAIFLVFFSYFMDWGILVPIWCFIFYKIKPKIFSLPLIFGLTLLVYVIFYNMHRDVPLLILNIIGMLFSFPLLWYYNGSRGYYQYTGRYFFYWFYGGHLLMLASFKFILDLFYDFYAP